MQVKRLFRIRLRSALWVQILSFGDALLSIHNTKKKKKELIVTVVTIVILLVAYVIWKERNNKLFNGECKVTRFAYKKK